LASASASEKVRIQVLESGSRS